MHHKHNRKLCRRTTPSAVRRRSGDWYYGIFGQFISETQSSALLSRRWGSPRPGLLRLLSFAGNLLRIGRPLHTGRVFCLNRSVCPYFPLCPSAIVEFGRDNESNVKVEIPWKHKGEGQRPSLFKSWWFPLRLNRNRVELCLTFSIISNYYRINLSSEELELNLRKGRPAKIGDFLCKYLLIDFKLVFSILG